MDQFTGLTELAGVFSESVTSETYSHEDHRDIHISTSAVCTVNLEYSTFSMQMIPRAI